MLAHVRPANDHVPDVRRTPDRGNPPIAFSGFRSARRYPAEPQAVWPARFRWSAIFWQDFFFDTAHQVNRADDLSFAQSKTGNQLLGDGDAPLRPSRPPCGSHVGRTIAAQPGARFGQLIGSLVRPRSASPDQLPLMGGETRQHRQHQAPGCGGGIELLRHAANSDAVLLQFCYSIQDQACVSPEAVQLENEELIEFVLSGIFQQANPHRAQSPAAQFPTRRQSA